MKLNGYHLCIDETALSKGDLDTILINRDKRGRKGSIIEMCIRDRSSIVRKKRIG